MSDVIASYKSKVTFNLSLCHLINLEFQIDLHFFDQIHNLSFLLKTVTTSLCQIDKRKVITILFLKFICLKKKFWLLCHYSKGHWESHYFCLIMLYLECKQHICFPKDPPYNQQHLSLNQMIKSLKLRIDIASKCSTFLQ